MAEIQFLIENSGKLYEPALEGEIAWETERYGSPGRLTFTVMKDQVLNFQEGNPVRLTMDGINVFYGFVFTKKRSKDKAGAIDVIAYDQLRYFKNKDAYIYPKAMTASELIQALARDYLLRTGDLENTGYVIPRRIENNQTLFDTIQTALDLTLRNTKKLYVLYDNFGKLTLNNIESLKLDVLINPETAENFDYTTSIDSGTYNQIKLYYDNDKTGKRESIVLPDEVNIRKWGVLQLCESVQDQGSIQAKAESLLSLYNLKTRSLGIKNAFGDIRVRGGSSVPVALDLGDIVANTYMVVERVKHSITSETHTMDLTLRGSGAYV